MLCLCTIYTISSSCCVFALFIPFHLHVVSLHNLNNPIFMRFCTVLTMPSSCHIIAPFKPSLYGNPHAVLLHHSQPSFVLCPLTIKPSSVHHNNLSFHHTKPYILVVIFPTATIYIFVPLSSSYMVFLFTTRTAHLHNLSLYHTNPNIPFTI